MQSMLIAWTGLLSDEAKLEAVFPTIGVPSVHRTELKTSECQVLILEISLPELLAGVDAASEITRAAYSVRLFLRIHLFCSLPGMPQIILLEFFLWSEKQNFLP